MDVYNVDGYDDGGFLDYRDEDECAECERAEREHRELAKEREELGEYLLGRHDPD